MAIQNPLRQIPIIDFAPFTQGNEEVDKQRVAQQIYAACHQIGFVYLCNHGIDQSLQQSLFAQAKQFFDLPILVKQQLARSQETNCGYISLLQERLDPANPGDLKEAFNIGVQAVWPPGHEEFRSCVLEFYRLCTTVVAPNLLQAFAIALHLPEHFFDDKHTQNYFLRMLHYPPINTAPLSGQLRAGEHTDYGSISLLLQDDVGGLEVRTRGGDWIGAPPIPGTLLVNVGDAMQRWTNDQLCSTPHRVVVPTGVDARKSRYSIAVFCDPNSDVEITCLESCQSPERTPRYSPILAGDYLASRFAATYQI